MQAPSTLAEPSSSAVLLLASPGSELAQPARLQKQVGLRRKVSKVVPLLRVTVVPPLRVTVVPLLRVTVAPLLRVTVARR